MHCVCLLPFVRSSCCLRVYNLKRRSAGSLILRFHLGSSVLQYLVRCTRLSVRRKVLLSLLRLPAHAFISTRHYDVAVKTMAQCTPITSDPSIQTNTDTSDDDSDTGSNGAYKYESLKTSKIAPRNIWCVERNYKEHAKELDSLHSTASEVPVLFLKPGSSMLDPGRKLLLPCWSSSLHHQVELAIILNNNMKPTRAAVALNLTARDVQAKLQHQQWPSTLATSFPHSTPIGSLFSVRGVDLQKLELHVEVNGETRQRSSTSDMMFKVPCLLRYIRKHFSVSPGDVVLSGTQAHASALKPGDKIVARVVSGSKVLSSGEWEVVTGGSSKQPATQKIVINTI